MTTMSSYREAYRSRKTPSIARTLFGWILLGAGVLGLLLPILPGLPLLFVGLLLLSGNYRWARQSLRWLRKWARKIAARVRRASDTETVEQSKERTYNEQQEGMR